MKISAVFAFAFVALCAFECCVSGTNLMIFDWGDRMDFIEDWRGVSPRYQIIKGGGTAEKDFE